MPVIEVNHVTKEYRLGVLHNFKHTLQNLGARLRGERIPKPLPFKALDDVDFKVEQGEVVGIIGHNGAGKSTLLKHLAGITTPTRGSVVVRGKVAPLIEVGAGLIGDLTGRENIYLNATILGLKRKEIDRKFDEIVAFTELEEFIDTPIKRYSSGMSVRLGFSIATSVDTDILIVDEVLAVGDLAFQRKCFDRMEDLIKEQGKTVLVVSHNIRQIERLCSRVVLLSNGRILMDDAPIKTCNRFFEINDDKVKASRSTHAREMKTGDIELIDVRLTDNAGNYIDQVTTGYSVNVVMTYQINNPLKQVNFGIGFHTIDFIYLSTSNWIEQLPLIDLDPGEVTVSFCIRCLPLLPRRYSLRVGASIGEMLVPVYYAEGILQFQVMSTNISISSGQEAGFFTIQGRWNLAAGKSPVNFSNQFGILNGSQLDIPGREIEERLIINSPSRDGQ